ncbi:MAG: right-handed parallel beta-helix repeat-containing protein [Anaerolineaceae bacterium]
MNKKKHNPIIAIVLIGILIFPSENVQASKGIKNSVNTNSNGIHLIYLTGTELKEQKSQDLFPLTTDMEEQKFDAQNPYNIYLPFIITNSITKENEGYFVSPFGNDSNPGTLSKPWRTLLKAGNTAIAGDTVKLLPGTYSEKLIPKNSGTADAIITYTADPGTVTLDGTGISMTNDANGDGLVQILGKSFIKIENLTLKNASVNCVNISSNSTGLRPSHIDIRNLIIQNCNLTGIRASNSDYLLIENNQINHVNYSSGIGVWWSKNVIVNNNSITNAHYYHFCQGAYEEALTIAGTNNFEVAFNTLDNTEPPPSGFCETAEKIGIDVKTSSFNGIVHHNSVRNMNAAGIYIDGWDSGSNGTSTLNHIDIYQNQVSNGGGITVGCELADGVVEYINIFNNLIINASYSAIEVRGAYGDGLRKNINIYNNTIYGALPAGGNGGAGIYVTTDNLGSNNSEAPVIIRNNISFFYFLYNGGGSVGQIRAGNSSIASKILADHNLVYGPQVCSQDFPACVEVGSRLSAVPSTVFLNISSFDLRLMNGAAAINTGVTIGIVETDFIGTIRPTGGAYDIGAYELN